jgi:predicted Rossmann fold nucleotide-binding protein DprA/Smf involved in DNA uptake
MVFLGSSCRETAKNAIKKESMGKDDRNFPPKVFDMDFPPKVLMVNGVFELPLLRNAQKRHKT